MRAIFAGTAVVAVLAPMAGAAGPATAAPRRPACQGRPATIVGTTHHVNGTSKDDVIVVLTEVGITYIRARGGDDLICGGDSHDFLYDGKGHDRFYGGKEPNDDGHSFPAFSAYYLVGGPGDDLIIGGPLGDWIGGGPGNDILQGRGGRDFIDATDDTGIDGYQHYADQVDGGRDDEADVALCDELDVLTNVSVRRDC